MSAWPEHPIAGLGSGADAARVTALDSRSPGLHGTTSRNVSISTEEVRTSLARPVRFFCTGREQAVRRALTKTNGARESGRVSLANLSGQKTCE
jgi:hypothetical protein